MGRIISITNQKGGVGKTTTAINLAAGISMLGRKVLIVDFDPQGNCTSGLGIKSKKENTTVYEVLMGEDPKNAILKTKIDNCHLIPANINLTGATVELVNVTNREFYLKNVLNKIKNDYDYIFVDCPPSLGILTLNSLVASDSVLIPIQTEFFALEGLTQLINTINLVKKTYNQTLVIEGVLLTMLDKRTHLTNDVAKNVVGYFGKKVYTTVIPRNVRLAEAPSYGEPIFFHDPECLGAKAYKELALEFING
ncbi:MAG: ParA family protein [Spirochaetes bacterium]|nr:ParA family protein [Spirochaetota bacterium]